VICGDVQVLNATGQSHESERRILHKRLDLPDMWLEYCAVSGSVPEKEIAVYAAEVMILPQPTLTS
jgi:hypothetical protein